MSTMTPAQLGAWIEDLRGRLERGELRSRHNVEAYTWYLLNQVVNWRAAHPAEQRTPLALVAQRQLAAELAALHAHLVEGKPAPLITEAWR